MGNSYDGIDESSSLSKNVGSGDTDDKLVGESVDGTSVFSITGGTVGCCVDSLLGGRVGCCVKSIGRRVGETVVATGAVTVGAAAT